MNLSNVISKIDIDTAQRQFHGDIKADEYVAWWVSNDRNRAVPAAIGSYATAEAALQAAAQQKPEFDDQGYTGGTFEVELVEM